MPTTLSTNVNIDIGSRMKKQELKVPELVLSFEERTNLENVVKQLRRKQYDCSSGELFLKKFNSHLLANGIASSGAEINKACVDSIELQSSDEELESSIFAAQVKKWDSFDYRRIHESRLQLPAFECAGDIVDAVYGNQVVVLCGETGSGKTTQVCQYLLDAAISEGRGSVTRILCTQPRRISAISVAERVAEERGEELGLSVGYSIRLESCLPSLPAGTITFVTVGVVFQYLKDDPNLSSFSCIIVDEVHERDILTDFLLAILKDLVARRPSLKVILMSATLNAASFSKYFKSAPISTIPGRLYPVTAYYLEDVITKLNFVFDDRRAHLKSKMDHQKLIQPFVAKYRRDKSYPESCLSELQKAASEELNLDLIYALTLHIAREDPDYGTILIFMSGWETICKLHSKFQESGDFDSGYLLIPLHSSVPTHDQKQIFRKPAFGTRKIIISTNIAETSVTIDDVVHVIDSGRIKMTNFDPLRNIQSLDEEWTSLANSKQRRGRAGRVQAGFCYHLFSRARESRLEEFKKPEILRTRLEEVILQIKMLKLGNAEKFMDKLLDTPTSLAIQTGVQRLLVLNAIDVKENLTHLGYHLAHLPMDPQTGKMILYSAIFSCVDPILSIAACLTFKDPFYVPLGMEADVDSIRNDFSRGTRSDHLMVMNAIKEFEDSKGTFTAQEFCNRHFISRSNLRLILNLKRQFAQHLARMKFLASPQYKDESCNRNSDSWGVVGAVLTAGLFPNVMEVRMTKAKLSIPRLWTLEDGESLRIHKKSVNKKGETLLELESPYMVYYSKLRAGCLSVHDTSMALPLSLIFFGGRQPLPPLTWTPERTLRVSNGKKTKIQFPCPDKKTADVLSALRNELDRLLEHKMKCPGVSNWDVNSKEGLLLTVVSKEIQREYDRLMKTDESAVNRPQGSDGELSASTDEDSWEN